MTKDELISAWAEWLSPFRWNWWGTLAFRRSVLMGKADWIFKEWVSDLRAQSQANDDFRCFRVTEIGEHGKNLRFYVLVGGLRKGCKDPALHDWKELAGDAGLTYYTRSGGIRSVLETLLPDQEQLDVDFILRSNWR